ncbi:MAG: hypothetical protein IJE22_09000 [Oscillibacter sp.]|nr:hypothetical protein [Oscillibacter sp.]
MRNKTETSTFPKGAQLVCRNCNIRAYNLVRCPRCHELFTLAEPEKWMAEEKKEEGGKRGFFLAGKGRKAHDDKEVTAPVEKETAVPEMEEPAAPAVEELAAPVMEEPSAFVPEKSAVSAVEELAAPVMEEPAVFSVEELAAPAVKEPAAPVAEEPSAPAAEVEFTGIPVVDELRGYKRQLDLGEISKEEFEEKKAALLGL